MLTKVHCPLWASSQTGAIHSPNGLPFPFPQPLAFRTSPFVFPRVFYWGNIGMVSFVFNLYHSFNLDFYLSPPQWAEMRKVSYSLLIIHTVVHPCLMDLYFKINLIFFFILKKSCLAIGRSNLNLLGSVFLNSSDVFSLFLFIMHAEWKWTRASPKIQDWAAHGISKAVQS